MNLKRVTVTGADDSIDPMDLVNLQLAYPFAEFGILLSEKQVGNARFPSFDWQQRLVKIARHNELNLCAHFCGAWTRHIMLGSNPLSYVSNLTVMCQRIQLNFHGMDHQVNVPAMVENYSHGTQYILQFDDVNNNKLKDLQNFGLDAVALFDLSGGAGIIPESWPKAILPSCGYAGGLSPTTVVNELERIRAVCGEVPIWIDAETHLRSEDDKVFDLKKVEAFLRAAEPFVTQ